MTLEKLSRGIYDLRHQDFNQCEGLWDAIETDKAQAFATSTQETLKVTRPEEDISFLDWENITRALERGRVVELMPFFLRERNTLPKCPLCGSNIPTGTEALSRRDNQTLICSDCGQREALDEHEGQRG